MLAKVIGIGSIYERDEDWSVYEIKTPLLIQIATPQTKGVKGWLMAPAQNDPEAC